MSGCQLYYKLEGNHVSPCDISEVNRKQIACDYVHGVKISTVFLGIDHSFDEESSPILFETMIFGGPLNGMQQRYETYLEAEEGHQIYVNRVKGIRLSSFYWYKFCQFLRYMFQE